MNADEARKLSAAGKERLSAAVQNEEFDAIMEEIKHAAELGDTHILRMVVDTKIKDALIRTYGYKLQHVMGICYYRISWD